MLGVQTNPTPDDVATLRLSIGRMTCAACVNTVTDALEAVPGVVRADVSLLLESADVAYRGDAATLERLTAAVESAGYAATALGGSAMSGDDAAGTATGETHSVNGLLVRAGASIAAAAAIMGGMWTAEALAGDAEVGIALNVGAFAISTPIVVWVGSIFFRSAYSALRRRSSNMDTLISLGVGAAYVYSTLVTAAQLATGDADVFGDSTVAGGTTYFEVAAAIIGLVALGRWLEATTRRRSSAAVRRLMELRPRAATVERGGELVEVRADRIAPGDVVLTRPGERVAADGVVASGTAEVDESMLTGESVPATKRAGDRVYSGTVCVNGAVRATATGVGDATLLSDITRKVAQALASRAPIERLVDRVTRYFVPSILVVALATFVVWLALDPARGVASAVIAATTVLVVSCPCALGLATPTAVVAGIGRASELSALVRSSTALERLAAADVAVFDKTGTVTRGELRVVEVRVADAAGLDVGAALRLAASVEAASEHPIARAIVRRAAELGVEPAACADFENEPGVGVSGVVDGVRVEVRRVGRGAAGGAGDGASLPAELTRALEAAHDAARGAVAVLRDGVPIALVDFADEVRPEAAPAISELRRLGLRARLLTGDSAAVARAVGEQVGVDALWAEVSPAGKAETVRRARRADGDDGDAVVVMVGDGINDGPALAVADVGLAMGAGTDVALETADVALVGNDLSAVPTLVRLSRATVRTIRQNLAWAFGYNLLLVPVAAGVLVPLWSDGTAPALLRPVISAEGALNPIAAAGAMALSSLSVSLNALRLRRFR